MKRKRMRKKITLASCIHYSIYEDPYIFYRFPYGGYKMVLKDEIPLLGLPGIEA
jgi:hypothetical protein